MLRGVETVTVQGRVEARSCTLAIVVACWPLLAVLTMLPGVSTSQQMLIGDVYKYKRLFAGAD